MRIRIAHEGGAIPRGRRPPGEARDRKIEASPEKLNGTALPDERRPRFREHAIDLDENAPEPVRELRIVRMMSRILVESNG